MLKKIIKNTFDFILILKFKIYVKFFLILEDITSISYLMLQNLSLKIWILDSQFWTLSNSNWTMIPPFNLFSFRLSFFFLSFFLAFLFSKVYTYERISILIFEINSSFQDLSFVTCWYSRINSTSTILNTYNFVRRWGFLHHATNIELKKYKWTGASKNDLLL